MKHYLLFLFIILSVSGYSQDSFLLKINTSGLKADSLILSTPESRIGFEEFYDFEIESLINLKSIGMTPVSGYFLKLSGTNFFKGRVAYPIPVAFIHIDFENPTPPDISDVFFLESGEFSIHLHGLKHKQDINIVSGTNIEYRDLKSTLKSAYVKANNPFQIDSLIDFHLKKKLLANYIHLKPDSYVALWEVIKDYQFYQDEGMDFSILDKFSENFKKNKLFKLFKSKIDAEKISQEGMLFPEVVFENNQKLGAGIFNNYSVTLIDYWSTTCRPCITSMPELSEINLLYKEKGLNIVAVADDPTEEAKNQARQLFKKNNIKWDNYFDDNDDFKNKVNATGYPLYFLVDSGGKIIYRGSSLAEVKKIIHQVVT